MATRTTDTRVDEQCVNSIRFLAIDAVEKAKSGHPGAPMGAAAMAYVLWDRYLKHNPGDPSWPDRDRFILSAGHASMLLYSLLHLTGYDVSIEDIAQFRQWGSRTPGHPEFRVTPGAEMTTGPLGQGFAHGVGMAIAQQWLADHYNRPGHEIIDHYIYVIASDGDLQEGVASEAASLAGTLKLGKLVYLYDDNGISIEGDTDINFQENVGDRFRAYGWHVVGPVDGMDLAAVDAAFAEARAETERPSLIIAETTIGYGSPNKANTGGVHGAALGAEEVALTRQALGWPYEPFDVPEEALGHMREALERGANDQQAWEQRMEAYRQAYPAEAAQLAVDLSGDLPPGWADELPGLFADDEKPLATREASNRVMNAIAQRVHGLTGGSADLAPSTSTLLKGHGDFGFAADVDHNMHFGVREHAMGAIAGGHGVARRAHPLHCYVPHLLRLHAPADAACRPDGAASRLCVHPRLRRSRRGRPDSPAGGAVAWLARHAEPRCAEAGGRHRDRRGVARRPGAPERPHRVGAHAAGCPHHRPHGMRAGGRRPTGRLRTVGGVGGPGRHTHWHGLRGGDCVERRGGNWSSWECPHESSRSRRGSCSTRSRTTTVRASYRRRSRPALRSRRARLLVGSGTPAAGVSRSALTGSAPPLPIRGSTRSSS